MKKLIVLAALLFSSPAFAQTASTVAKPKVYRAFVYETNCILEYGIQTYDDICKVIETRETGGALRTRNIFSNKFGLTIKSRFDKEKGFVTWDSHNKFEYKFDYKVGGTGWSYVMPGLLLENVSWD
jgi:hypothetical protein